MAEDIILRLRGENADLKAKLAEATAEVEKLGVAVAGVNAQGAGAGGGALAKMADEADVLGFNIEQVTRDTEGMGAAVVRGFDFQTVKKFAGGIEEGAVATAKTTGLLGKANSALLGVNVSAGKLGSIISKVSPEVGFLVAKFGALAVPITAVLGATKAFSAAIDVLANKTNVLEKLGFGEFQIKGLQALLHDLANPLDILIGKSESWGLALEDVRKRFGFIVGYTEEAANAQEILTKFTKEHEAAIKRVVDEQANFNEELQKATLGTTFKDIEAEVDGVTDSFKLLQTLGLDQTGEHADRLRERVAKLGELLQSLGPNVEKALSPDKLKAFESLRDLLGESAEATDDLVKSQLALVEVAGDAVKELDKEVDKLRDLRNEIDGVGADVLGITGDIRSIFADAADGSGSEIDSLRAKIAALAQEEEKLARAFNTTEAQEFRRQEIAAERADLERDLIDAQRNSSGDYELSVQDQIDIQSKFRDALVAAKAEIANWPESARGAMQSVLNQFQFLNEEVNVSLRDVEEFETAFRGAMAAAGSATTTLETKLQRDMQVAREEYAATAQAAVDAYDLMNTAAAQFTEELRTQRELVNGLAQDLAKLDSGGEAAVN